MRVIWELWSKRYVSCETICSIRSRTCAVDINSRDSFITFSPHANSLLPGDGFALHGDRCEAHTEESVCVMADNVWNKGKLLSLRAA